MIKRILIANRGEIACRVIKTARKMGIETVSVYSEADRKSMHVQMADKAVLIGPPPTSKSYLDMNKILNVCISEKVDAVHPGYGFLSENFRFMDLLDQNNIIFIGPKKKAIEEMGDKINSKRLAKAANVNLIPGHIGEVANDPEEILRIARSIGYPIMIKASAGGGGKGMRIAYNDQEAVQNFKIAKEESFASFGDDRILMEKYIEEPRHIEINILGDKQGNIVYLPERECSIQRRNQKVLEEAPSPFIDPETRRKMGEQAVALARAVQYETSGTVEFMVDKHKHWYFLEMNTRLQVEHPITEAITGIDLVEEMINVAQGKPLSITQDMITINGHALESRVYAEDPYRGFLPSIGHLLKYQEPKHEHIRIDTGVREGDEISMYYDPLISKTVTWGKDRNEAIELMKHALDTYVIRGLGHNVPFCRDVLRQPKFVSGNYSTKFIPETYPQGFRPQPLTATDKVEVAGFLAAMRDVTNKFAVHTLPWESYVIKIGKEFYGVEKPQEGKTTVVRLDSDEKELSKEIEVNAEVNWNNSNALIQGKVNNKEMHMQFHEHTHSGYMVAYQGHHFKVEFLTANQYELVNFCESADVDAASQKEFLAPMPGAVISVSATEGMKVEVGQELAILEAMKMRNVMRAEKKGTVKKVLVKAGQSVQVDQVLFEIE